ncbi:phosphate-starvation-inducible protein PsiE [Allochromatium vinosum]|uniref:phosphate-starvation-inducible protein PsiE n=1 Tax=Allochromatium vinosum TaxID=1049 RepID=UPI0019062E0F|nr:phosphate-starvation-inducible PsiE family protein [Allochromatium vinosum]MBK1653828.1 phosphate-starvation-inducible E [Allochromatium vinosum]
MNEPHTRLDKWLSILFLYTEKLVLVVIGGLALLGIGELIWSIYQLRAIRLEDLLMMFIFIEIMAMANVYFMRRSVPFTYPMFIAVTALSRLIVLQGKEHSAAGLIYESGAILLISLAILVIRFSQQFSTGILERREAHEDRHE